MKHKTNFYTFSFVFLIVSAILFSSCAYQTNAISQDMQSWVGRHQSELIASWGPPQNTSIDGKGGTVLVYSEYVDLGQTPGTIKRKNINPLGNKSILGDTSTYEYTPPKQKGYYKKRMFYVNPDGYIYTYKWEGF
jgi:hypothetical protein